MIHCLLKQPVTTHIRPTRQARLPAIISFAHFTTLGMPTVISNCSNNYGPYQFPEKLIPLFINNISNNKPLPVYGKRRKCTRLAYVEDHARAIDLVFHKGTVGNTYNIGGFNEWTNIDLIKVMIRTVDRLLGKPEDLPMDLSPMSPIVQATIYVMLSMHQK